MKEENIIHVKQGTQSIEAKAEMLQALTLPDKDLKITINNMWKEWIT